MTQSTIAAEIHQPFNIHRDFAPKITFDGKLRDLVPQLVQLRVGDIFNFGGNCNSGCRANLARAGATNSINGCQCDFGMLMIRDIYSSDTGHTLFLQKFFNYNIYSALIRLTLTLLVPRVGADDANDAIAPNDFAIAANLFY
jgi:hypothetical protein